MKHILAVDDNLINLELLKQIIKVNYPDFTMASSLNGEEGISTAVRSKPDLILLDILMPGMDGFETCRRLKNNPSTKHIPIIMISALGQDAAERTKGLNAGADAFISKPFDHSELKAQINVALRIKEVEDLLRKRNEVLEYGIKQQSNYQRDQEERFQQISEQAREFYWEVDVNNTLTYLSPVVEKTFGIFPLDVIGKKTLFELLQYQDSEFIGLFNTSERFHDMEVKMTHNNQPTWLSISGFSYNNKEGRLAGKRGMCLDITRRKTAEDSLKQNLSKIEKYQTLLKKLNSEITLVEENERRRIAENLHDSLGQTLSMAYMQLSSIDMDEILPKHKNSITYVSTLLNKAIEESRRLTYDLSPPILYELGLLPAVRWKLDQIRKEYNLDYKIEEGEQDLELSKEYNVFLYRTICEILQNTVKHAKASCILFKNSMKGNKLHIEVSDNGVGFDIDTLDKSELHGGFGLLSIKERIDSISGAFYIYSQPNSGTKAEVVVPI